MNFLEAQQWWPDERIDFINSMDLWWAEKYIHEKEYVHSKRDDDDWKREQTYAFVIPPNRAEFWLRKWRSTLKVLKWLFWRKNTVSKFISIVRDHEWKHAHISYKFPDIFDQVYPWTPSKRLTKVRSVVEEIICDEFQIFQAEDTWLELRETQIRELRKSITRNRKHLGRLTKKWILEAKAEEVIAILEWNHRFSREIRFGK